ncbi:hypothetical protein LCGC14_1177070 [marine sediment metagenome]|uniref:ERCC4 domain-containing protein n=1 Tax=marine sediment metagenome TaxID=412755 RepID=A0A0F9PTL3_9ZZZZ
MNEIYYVDSSERKTVDVLTKMEKNFKLVNNILWFCNDCDLIYKEKPDECECGSKDVEFEKIADIRGPNWEYAIEIKIGDDLYNSLDNRVYAQLEGLSGFLKGKIALVFVGNLEKLALEHPDRAGQIRSIPATCMQYGVSWINVKSIIELVKLLKHFAAKAGKSPKLRIKRTRSSDIMPKRMMVLLSIKGVGEKMALELSKVYPSIYGLCHDLYHGLIRAGMIKGLGPEGIRRLKDWLVR